MVNENNLFFKVAGMFRPINYDFLDFRKDDVIAGPNDRSMFGFDTFFPIDWLVEDYGFTKEEARQFIEIVKQVNKEKEK